MLFPSPMQTNSKVPPDRSFPPTNSYQVSCVLITIDAQSCGMLLASKYLHLLRAAASLQIVSQDYTTFVYFSLF